MVNVEEGMRGSDCACVSWSAKDVVSAKGGGVVLSAHERVRGEDVGRRV